MPLLWQTTCNGNKGNITKGHTSIILSLFCNQFTAFVVDKPAVLNASTHAVCISFSLLWRTCSAPFTFPCWNISFLFVRWHFNLYLECPVLYTVLLMSWEHTEYIVNKYPVHKQPYHANKFFSFNWSTTWGLAWHKQGGTAKVAIRKLTTSTACSLYRRS